MAAHGRANLAYYVGEGMVNQYLDGTLLNLIKHLASSVANSSCNRGDCRAVRVPSKDAIHTEGKLIPLNRCDLACAYAPASVKVIVTPVASGDSKRYVPNTSPAKQLPPASKYSYVPPSELSLDFRLITEFQYFWEMVHRRVKNCDPYVTPLKGIDDA